MNDIEIQAALEALGFSDVQKVSEENMVVAWVLTDEGTRLSNKWIVSMPRDRVTETAFRIGPKHWGMRHRGGYFKGTGLGRSLKCVVGIVGPTSWFRLFLNGFVDAACWEEGPYS